MPIIYNESLGEYQLVETDGTVISGVPNLNYSPTPGSLSLNPSTSKTRTKTKTMNACPDVFIRKQNVKTPGLNIGAIMRTRKVTGDIGIEIEVEGKNLPKVSGGPFGSFKQELIPPQWAYHHDGSLRGLENAEYVLKKPIKFSEVKYAIDTLWDMFAKAGSKLDDSNRTSIHIHLNAQSWHLNRVCAFAALYFSLEELLTEWCGDHRVGNLFCLRAKDAPGIVSKLKDFIVTDGQYPLSEGLHYGGLNVHALCKYGSLEIRALRGCTDPNTIMDWVAILQKLYDLSGEYKDPRAICENFSGEGPMAYLFTALGPKAQVIKDGVKWDNQRIMESLYEGIRLAQDLCYCRDWSDYHPVNIAPDPFNRDPVKIAAELAQSQSAGVPLGAPPVGWNTTQEPLEPSSPEDDDWIEEYLNDIDDDEDEDG